MRRFALFVLALLSACALGAAAADPSESDEYTRYELLAPGSSQFHILYEVTATSPGATYFFNPIRKGSEASGESVVDLMSGEPLAFERRLRRGGARERLGRAETDTDYIRIKLARPVPADGGVRLLIDKTYKDPKSYFRAATRSCSRVRSGSSGTRRSARRLRADRLQRRRRRCCPSRTAA